MCLPQERATRARLIVWSNGIPNILWTSARSFQHIIKVVLTSIRGSKEISFFPITARRVCSLQSLSTWTECLRVLLRLISHFFTKQFQHLRVRFEWRVHRMKSKRRIFNTKIYARGISDTIKGSLISWVTLFAFPSANQITKSPSLRNLRIPILGECFRFSFPTLHDEDGQVFISGVWAGRRTAAEQPEGNFTFL